MGLSDIVVGLAAVCLLSMGLFALTLRRARAWSVRARACGASVAVGGIVLFALLLRDNLLLAELLPVSNVMVVGNWTPLAVAVFVGLAWHGMPGSAARRSALLAPLVVGCLVFSYGPLVEKRPHCEDRWSEDGVCLQTSAASCSAAAAAALLMHHGIRASESEMAALCFTSRRGTTRLGLYRGLKLKTRGTLWDVRVFRGALPELRRSLKQPMLLFVGLTRRERARLDPRYEHEWGWRPGVTHTVLLYRFLADGRIEMADPSYGCETWHAESLEVLWHGEGLQLVRR